MKTSLRFHFTFLVVSLLAWFMTACSGSDNSISSKLNSYAPEDASMLWAIDFQKVINATESEINSDGQLAFSSHFRDILRLQPLHLRRGIELLTRNPYMRWTNAVGISRRDDNETSIVIWSVTDAEDFTQYLANEEGWDLSSIDDWSIAAIDGQDAIVAKDGLAFIALDGTEPVDARSAIAIIEAFRTAAQHSPLPDWQLKALDRNKLLTSLMQVRGMDNSCVDMAKAFVGEGEIPVDGALSIYFDIDGKQAEFDACIVDSKGNEAAMAWGETIDPQLLEQLPADAYATFAAGRLPILPGLFTSQNNKHAEIFTGQVAIALAPRADKTINSLSDISPENIAVCATLQCASKRGKEALDIVAKSLGQTRERTDTSAIVDFVYGTKRNPQVSDYLDSNYYIPASIPLTCALSGNIITITNTAAKATNTASATAETFAGKTIAANITLQPSDPTVKLMGLDFALEVNAWVEGPRLHINAKVDGTEQQLIKALASRLVNAD